MVALVGSEGKSVAEESITVTEDVMLSEAV